MIMLITNKDTKMLAPLAEALQSLHPIKLRWQTVSSLDMKSE